MAGSAIAAFAEAGATQVCISSISYCGQWEHAIQILLAPAVYRQAFQEAIERAESLNGELVPVDFGPFCEVAELLYNSAFVAERYAGIRSFIDCKVCSRDVCTEAMSRTWQHA